MSEAEGVAKRAEEELAVAKERLLLQEDELQSRAGSRPVRLPLATSPHLSSHLSAGHHVADIELSSVLSPLFILTQH